MIVKTKFTSNANGRSQVVAKGAGKQRTTAWDSGHSTDWNHGHAAAVLLMEAHNWDASMLDSHLEAHTANDSGTEHTFTLTYKV